MKKELWEKELWTQGEVAEYFRVVSSTVKNWREQGLLSCWRVPGSSKVLYYRDDIRDFLQKHTTAGTGKEKKKPQAGNQRVKPRVSPDRKEWRI